LIAVLTRFVTRTGVQFTSPENAFVDADMTERLDILKKARERMVEERDAHAKVLAAPFDRDKSERARNKFVETQTLIDAIDRAIAGEPTT